MTAHTMKARRKRRVDALRRRRDFLASRISEYKGRNPSWDKAECAALTWAIQVVQAAEVEGVITDLEQIVVKQ